MLLMVYCVLWWCSLFSITYFGFKEWTLSSYIKILYWTDPQNISGWKFTVCTLFVCFLSINPGFKVLFTCSHCVLFYKIIKFCFIKNSWDKQIIYLKFLNGFWKYKYAKTGSLSFHSPWKKISEFFSIHIF